MTYREKYTELIEQAEHLVESTQSGYSHDYGREAIRRMVDARDHLSPTVARMEYVPYKK